MEQYDRYLEEESLSKLMLKFSIPCVLSMLVGALYNIVDQILSVIPTPALSALQRHPLFSR